MKHSERKTFSAWNIGFVVLLIVGLFLLVALPTSSPHHRTSPRNICINYLRMIDGAKQQWAIENHKQTNAIPTAKDVASYFKDGKLPKCPEGGKYTIGRVDEDPKCSIPGHKLE